MELQLIFITFLLWFSTWTFLESIIKQKNISNKSILRLSFLGIIISIYLYQTRSDTSESNE
jgi:hypothetical protein